MAIEFGSPTLPKMKDGRNGTILGGDYFNPLFERFDGRLHVLEELRVSWLDAVDTVTRQGLSRIDVVLGPAFEKLGRVLELGFLIAESETEITLAVDGERTFVLAEGEQSDLFTPTSLLSLQRQSDPSTWAIVRLAAPYNRTSRELQVTVLSFAGAPGPFSDWELGALAGSTAAQYLMLQTAMTTMAQISADRDAVALIKTDVLEAKQIASDKAAVATQKAQIATDKAAEALASANAAALFDPTSYYIKGQTYTRTEVQGLIATAVSNLVGGAPGALDALNELAAALGNDANFAATMTAALAARQVTSEKNLANGYAGLGGDGKVAKALLPIVGSVVLQTFTSSGTFIKEADDLGYMVELVDAGGGGNAGTSGNGTVFNPALALGGSFGEVFLLASEVAATETVTVGAPGPGGVVTGYGVAANGSPGGASSFGSKRVRRYPNQGAGGGGSPGQGWAGDGGANSNPGNANSTGGNGQAPGGAGGTANSTNISVNRTATGGNGARGEVRVYRIKG